MPKSFGLVGYPVEHSYSAIMHNAAFKELGIEAHYELFEIKPERLEEGFKQLIKRKVGGLNVTVPYKERIIQFLDKLDEEAKLIGAVNTIKVEDNHACQGFNTDGLGFIIHLSKVIGLTPQAKDVSILGCGGAARAVSMQLVKKQVKSILLYDIDSTKSNDLAAQLRGVSSTCRIAVVGDPNALLQEKPDLLINATPLGMHKDDPLVFDAEYLHPKLVVYDLVYNPAQTNLLRQAQRRGCAGVFNGLGMLLYQGALAFQIWLGAEPPIDVMEQALRGVLNKK